MRILSNLNTYYRLLLLILGTSALFFILYLCLYFYTLREEKNVYRTALREYNNEVNAIITLNSKTHISSNYYISFWDELVAFTKSEDKKWYHDNVEGDFESYESDYVGVYNLKNKLIVKTTTGKIKTVDFIPKGVFAQLYETKLNRFYLRIPEGIVEVFGATIHPTDDPKRNKYKPSGYFFIVRILDKKFTKDLEELSGSKITIVPNDYDKPNEKNEIATNVNLNDWQNNTIANIHFERSFNLNFNNTKKILGIIILGTLVNLLIYLYCYRKWVYKPINLVTGILETKDEQLMTNLIKLKGEFGNIGYLFKENNEQRKQLEIAKEKAEESDKLKSAFLANLSHEIRTPMNAIMGFSDLLSDSELQEKDRLDYLKIIKNSGKNLTSIIEDLVEMSKIDSKQITPNYKAVDLDQCLAELYHAIRVTIPEEKGIDFSIIQDRKLANKILTDETKLKQILTNLITNAIKFTKHGSITVSSIIDEKENSIKIDVKDTGKGISEANLQIIFDRFRRIEDDFSIEVSGLGLGLSISKAYVELLGGAISVESEFGKGSLFSFTIPLKYDESIKIIYSAPKTKRLAHGEKQTILIAEDDDINFLLFEKITLLRNYNVLRAVNGLEAVEICKDNASIGLVFMDIKMPIMDGFEAFEKIRKFNSLLPIIASTAYSSSEDKERIIAFGFTGYISKPINKNEIFELLDDIFNED
jgi:signal transduction histidine kinase/ActR/RegA family two-component response regulator